MSPQLYFSHYFTWSPCEAELCAREGRFDPAALRVFSCKLTLFSMITRCHWLHYFRQFRQIAPAQCSQLYTVTHTHTHTHSLTLSLSHTHTPRPPLFFFYPFESSGVENNVSMCDGKKFHSGGVERISSRRVKQMDVGYSSIRRKVPNPKSFFSWPCVCARFHPAGCQLLSASSTIRLQLLQTSTSVRMMEFASAATSYFFFSPLSSSLLLLPPLPPPNPPFFFFLSQPGAPVAAPWFINVYVFWSAGQKGLACDP